MRPLPCRILNLAFTDNNLTGFAFADINFDFEAKVSFLSTMQQLCEVFFLIEPQQGRLNFRWVYGMDQEGHFPFCQW